MLLFVSICHKFKFLLQNLNNLIKKNLKILCAFVLSYKETEILDIIL